MLAIARIPFILATTAGLIISLTDPNPLPPSNKERQAPQTLLAKLLSATHGMQYFQVVFPAAAAAEVAVIIADRFPSSAGAGWVLSVLSKPETVANLHFTPFSVTGMVIIIAATMLRILCYRTLKKFFTFHISLRKDHQLITTGPYSVVRHPSYTALIAVAFGLVGWYGAEGSWVRESGLLDTVAGKVFASAFTVACVANTLGLVQRTVVEDKMLRNVFGKTWDEWAQRVPYRLIPGIY
ncbi:Protein-S-isoprenylcysteine O-methyltransferase B [Hypsizygus marmoreus]|uniref:Protein-S-isoprenylcysteine O-methyltransferase n=1 Tax=Hypsizygus marmoreus TaxID=39966 RepID=A0A369JHI1_HYPMA|nr:Protein-S-isoprenylcysteine O-methyltransferase B [Hypsizygus marmoreus]